MSSAPIVRMLAENLPEHRILEAIFLPERACGRLKVTSYLTSSAALGAAEMSLLVSPEVPVALVLNAGRENLEEIAEERRTVHRILFRAAPADSWHVAWATPDVDAWMMADPRVKQIFDSDEATRNNRYERAVRIGELAKAMPIDREAIARVHPEFQLLAEFVERHANVAQTAP